MTVLHAIGESLPMAVGLALSPIPVAAVVGVLLSGRPHNAWAFLAGWIAGIVAVGVVVFVIPGLDGERGEPTRLSGWVRIGLGVGLLLLAGRKWRGRPPAGVEAKEPKIFAKLDSLGAGGTLAFGFVVSAINPKNLVLTFAAAMAIDCVGASPAGQGIALAVYATVASLSVILPTVIHSLFTERVRPSLADWKDWLVRNNAAVVTVLLIVFGALIVGNGLKVL